MKLRQSLSHPCCYLAGGAICAGLHNGVLIGADLVRIHYIVGMLISLIGVTPVGYLHQTIVTFGKPPSWPRFALFAIGTVSGFALSFCLMMLFCSGLGLPVFVATPAGNTVIAYIELRIGPAFDLARLDKPTRGTEPSVLPTRCSDRL